MSPTIQPIYNLSGVSPTLNSMTDKLQTAEASPQFNYASNYGISQLRDIITTNGGGNVQNSAETYQLSTSAASNDRAELQTAERGQFLNGAAFESGINVQVPIPPTGTQRAEWGYSDNTNGAYFGQDSSGVYVALLQNGVETLKVYQSSWNIDAMDGTGSSRVTLDTTDGYLYQVRYNYTYGQVEFRIIAINPQLFQQAVTVHRFTPSSAALLKDANQNIRATVLNGASGGAFSINVGGRYFTNLGSIFKTSRITTETRINATISSTAFTPTVSFRRKSFFPDNSTQVNSINLGTASFDILASADLQWEVRINSVLTGASFGAVSGTPSSESSLQSDILATAMNTSQGVRVLGGLSVAGTIEGVTNVQVPFTLPGNGNLTLALRTLNNVNGNASVSLRLEEFW
ncbi:hypothetical protein ACIFQM_08040 [Paenibacillus sp. NRS-1782]|uniref:hypothetical protein n=1 Tax=unclassified Paenibacillus TaxID=185978 RepID=UPI003D2A6CF1